MAKAVSRKLAAWTFCLAALPLGTIDAQAPSPAAASPQPNLMPTSVPAASPADSAAATEPAVTPDEATDTPERTRHEEPGVSYHSIGIGYRHAFVPQGLVELFVGDAPPGLRVPQLALEYASRRDGFQITTALTYQDFGFHGAFRNSNDDVYQYEWLDSNLKSLGLGAGFSWSSNFSDVFAIEGGLDFGVGYLLGHVTRTEAYPSLGNNPDGGHGFAPCSAPTTPGGVGSDVPAGTDFDPNRYDSGGGSAALYCAAPTNGGLTDPDVKNGQQYGVRYRNWANGGSLPVISWRLAPRLSFRFKVAPRFVVRLDTGFDLGSGVFGGLAAHYVF